VGEMSGNFRSCCCCCCRHRVRGGATTVAMTTSSSSLVPVRTRGQKLLVVVWVLTCFPSSPSSQPPLHFIFLFLSYSSPSPLSPLSLPLPTPSSFRTLVGDAKRSVDRHSCWYEVTVEVGGAERGGDVAAATPPSRHCLV
jgi:hypothetical protein